MHLFLVVIILIFFDFEHLFARNWLKISSFERLLPISRQFISDFPSSRILRMFRFVDFVWRSLKTYLRRVIIWLFIRFGPLVQVFWRYFAWAKKFCVFGSTILEKSIGSFKCIFFHFFKFIIKYAKHTFK